MIARRLVLAFLAIIVMAAAFARPALAEEPAAVVTAIYQRIVASYDPATNNTDNGMFTWEKRKDRHLYYSARLAKAWDHADAITAKGDQNPPGACPITNSQDPLVRAFDVAVERQDAKTATVLVHISQQPGPVERTDWGTIYYDMVLERGRWRIDDIRPGIGNDAWSLRREIVNHKG